MLASVLLLFKKFIQMLVLLLEYLVPESKLWAFYKGETALARAKMQTTTEATIVTGHVSGHGGRSKEAQDEQE